MLFGFLNYLNIVVKNTERGITKLIVVKSIFISFIGIVTEKLQFVLEIRK